MYKNLITLCVAMAVTAAHHITAEETRTPGAKEYLTAAELKSIGSGREPLFEEYTVFKANEPKEYRTYHVYGLVQTKAGSLLAFSEARFHGGDTSPMSSVLKRSLDGGKTWSDSTYLERTDGKQTWTQNAPVVDEQTGRIFWFYALNDKNLSTRVFYRYSDDDGRTWQPSEGAERRIEVTASFANKPYGWTFHMPGPGHGIQLRHQRGEQAGKNGRLVIPVWHRKAINVLPRPYGISMLVSDDHGKTWREAGDAGVEHGMNEGDIVEMFDGRILLNARTGGAGDKSQSEAHRIHVISLDGGETFGQPVQVVQAVPYQHGCYSGLASYGMQSKSEPGLLLFSRPADPKARRATMAVFASRDEGRTWPIQRTIFAGECGYSVLVVLSDRTIGLLYGKYGPGAGKSTDAVFARFNLEWLMQPDGTPATKKSSTLDSPTAEEKGK